jgi:hypothetical protein
LSPSLNDGERITAAYNLSAIESLVSTNYHGLLLLAIRSDDVDYDGYAKKWCFVYSSAGIAVDYIFYSTYDGVGFNSTTSKIIGISFISQSWFNSDKALKIAEENGGRDFRMKNPDYSIKASLSKPGVPNSTPFWYVTYRSKSDKTKSLMLGINAKTGEITLKYPSEDDSGLLKG